MFSASVTRGVTRATPPTLQPLERERELHQPPPGAPTRRNDVNLRHRGYETHETERGMNYVYTPVVTTVVLEITRNCPFVVSRSNKNDSRCRFLSFPSLRRPASATNVAVPLHDTMVVDEKELKKSPCCPPQASRRRPVICIATKTKSV